MAACALPIRELSASVTLDAARTQKKCLDVAESATHSGALVFVKERFAVWVVGLCMDKLAASQTKLIATLQGLHTEALLAEHFMKLSADLGNLSAMTFAVIDLANEIPKYADEWRPKLDIIAELAAHIDNFAESYRIAADEVCTSLLASMVEGISAQAAVPAH